MSLNKRLVAEIIDSKSVLIMVVDQNIISAEFTALDRGSLTNVAEWGIYVNRGSISFIDRTGFFDNQTVNKAGLLGYTVKFYLAEENSQYIIGTFKVQSASLDEETREVTIECISKLEELQRKERSTPVYPFEERSADLLLDDIIKQYNQDASDNMRYIQFGKDTQKLESTIIYCPYLGKESLWASIEKICQATMCRCYDTKNGNAIIEGSFSTETPIVVNPSNILDITDNVYVRVPNPSIEVTTREKRVVDNIHREGNLLDSPTVSFAISYDNEDSIPTSLGSPTSVSDCEYFHFGEDEYGETYAIIEKTIQTPYKLKPGCEIRETLDTESLAGTQGTTNKKIFSTGSVTRRGSFARSVEDSKIKLQNLFVIKTNKVGANINYRVRNIHLRFQTDHFVDGENVTEEIKGSAEEEVFNIPSNDLIQTQSYYMNPNGDESALGYNIVKEVYDRYGEGIECFEIECLFNDYYYENGKKAFDKNDLSSHFEKYDVIIPYVQKQGQKVPLRKNADGTPKKFRIIGISYLYDGLLRQRLQIQSV